MEVRTLKLDHFRNFQQVDLALQHGITLLYGANASGKTSLLESLFYLATSRSPRTTADRELVRWGTPAEFGAPPFARLQAEVVRGFTPTSTLIEVIIQWKSAGHADAHGTPAPSLDATTRKLIRINQKVVRASDLIGMLRVVLFTSADLTLLAGPPGARRRYLDIMLSQLSSVYLRALARYQTILQQRNSLLRAWRKQLRPPRAIDSELGYWDNELAQSGAVVMAERIQAIGALNQYVGPIYQRMSGTAPPLVVTYQLGGGEAAPQLPPDSDPSTLAQELLTRLSRIRNNELQRGQTLIGPHRDDVRFTVGAVNLGVYGSRGQQRAAVLALKLGEAEFMQARSGERPVLLLDDVLSELDATRRTHVLQAITRPDQQTLITATDLTSFDTAFLRHAHCVRVAEGDLCPKNP